MNAWLATRAPRRHKLGDGLAPVGNEKMLSGLCLTNVVAQSLLQLADPNFLHVITVASAPRRVNVAKAIRPTNLQTRPIPVAPRLSSTSFDADAPADA